MPILTPASACARGYPCYDPLLFLICFVLFSRHDSCCTHGFLATLVFLLLVSFSLPILIPTLACTPVPARSHDHPCVHPPTPATPATPPNPEFRNIDETQHVRGWVADMPPYSRHLPRPPPQTLPMLISSRGRTLALTPIVTPTLARAPTLIPMLIFMPILTHHPACTRCRS